MAKKSRDNGFDDGMISREQQRGYQDGLLRMGAPKSKTPRRMAKLVVWTFVFLVPALLILSLVISDNNRSLNAELSKTLKTQYNPSFRVRYDSIGAEVISAWYNKQSPPIDVDSTVQWPAVSVGQLSQISGATKTDTTSTAGKAILNVTGVSFLKGSQVESKGAAGRYEERLEYYALVNGVPQIIGVTIAIPNLEDINSNPVLMSAPSIIGKPDAAQVANDPASTPVSALGSVTLSEATKSIINAWAKAWTEDDPSALKQSTQDPNTDSIYRGLGGGWTYVPNSIQIDWSAKSQDGGGNAVARVRWQMQTPATILPATDGKAPQSIPGAVQQQSMDILVGKYESGNPSVLAWGQVGTYSELKAQSNALTKEDAAKLAPATTNKGQQQQGGTNTTPSTTAPTSAATQSADPTN